MTGILVKIPRNICSLSQVKFLVVVNLFVSRPSYNPFPGTMEKTSQERSPNLRLQRTKHNILPNFLSLRKVFFFVLTENILL
jgi:hypothetical protein